VVDDSNMWWDVVYDDLRGARELERKNRYGDWSDTKVLAVPIALTSKQQMNGMAVREEE
jgi:hypothetical protein